MEGDLFAMSKTIDERIVEMKFDNANFEKNVSTTMSTLDKLKSALKFKDAGEGLQKISEQASKMNLSGLSSAIETISDRFSVMGIVGMTAIQDITRAAFDAGKKIVNYLYDPIVNGGKRRAFNIEEAKFQLKGLGVAWEDVKDDIDYAVAGTAYGLDAAAKACSQLSASGIKAGDDMKKALRGISGVAAMTNSDYESIAHVFTTVAGNGKVMTEQLNMLSARGINAAATLAKYLNVTEAEVRKMVSESQINFDLFASAMDEAFGEHAKDANKTVTGTISNIKAAFAKIGANFFQPIIANEGPLVDFLNSIREKISEFKDLSADFVGDFLAGNAIKAIEFGTSLIKSIDLSHVKSGLNDIATAGNKIIKTLTPLWGHAKTLLSAINNIGSAVKSVTGTISSTLANNFSFNLSNIVDIIGKGVKNIEKISTKIKEFASSSKVVNTLSVLFTNLSKAIHSIFDAAGIAKNIIVDIFGYAVDGIKRVSSIKLSEKFISLSESVVKIGSKIKDIVSNLSDFIKKGENAEKIRTIFQGVAAALELCAKGIGKVAKFGKNIFGNIADTIKESNILSGILDFLVSIAKAIIDVNNGTINLGGFARRVLGNVIELLKNLTKTVKTLFGDMFGGGKITKTLTTITGKVKEFISGFTGKSLGEGNKFGDNITQGLTEFRDKSKGIMDSITTNFHNFVEKIKNAPSSIQNSKWGPALSAIGKLLLGFLNLLTSVVNMVASLFNGLAKEFENNPFTGLVKAFKTVESLFINTKIMGAIGRIFGSIKSFKDVSTLSPLDSFMATLTKLGNKAQTDLPAILGSFRKFFDGFGNTITTFNQRMKKEGNAASAKGFAAVVASLAALILAVGALFYLIGQVDTNGVEQRMIVMSALMVELGILIGVVNNMSKKMTGTSVKSLGKLFLLMTIVLSIVAAISSMIKSMAKLQDMDTDKIYAALISVSAIMWELVGVTAVLNKIKAESFSDVATSMLIMAFGIRVCAGALASLGSLNWNQLAVGVTGLAAIMTGMVLVSKYVNKIKIGDVSGMLVMAVAIGILGKAFTSLAQLSWEQFGVGISGVTAMLFEMVLATRMLKESGMDLSVGASMLLMAASIGILANALSKLSNLNADQLTQGWLAMAATMLYLLGFMKLMPDTCLQTAAALLVVSISLSIVAKTIKSLGSMDFMGLVKALAGLAIGIAAIWVILKVMSDNVSGAFAMAIVAAGLIALATGMKILGTMNPKQVAMAIIALAGALLILAPAIYALSDAKMLLGAAAIMVVSVALIALAAALTILGSMTLAEVGTALLALAGVLVIFGVAAAALMYSGAIIAVALLAASLFLMAAGVAVVGVGLVLIVDALAQLAIVGPSAAEAMVIICKTVAENYEEFLKASKAMIEFAKGLAALGGALIVAGLGLMTLSVAVGLLSIALIALSLAMIVVAAAILVVEAALAALKGQFGETKEAVGEVVDDFGQAGEEMLDSFVDGLTRGFKDAIEKIKQIGKSIWEAFTGAFGGEKGVEEEAYEQGKAVGESYQKGIEDSKAKAEEKKSGGFIDSITDKLTGGSGLSIGGVDMTEMITGGGDVTNMIGDLNNGLIDTKSLTGDSASNIQSMANGTSDTTALMEQMGVPTDIIAENTGTAADNMDQISKTDVSNVEALSEANLDGLTDSKQVQELDKTKEAVDAITESVDKTNEKEIKPKVDTSDLDKLVDDVMHGKYGNGMERMIALAEKYGEVQNKVNEKLGSSKRYEEGVDYSKGKTASNVKDNANANNLKSYEEGLEINQKLKELQDQYANIIQSNAPESEKEAIRKRVSEQTKLWSEYWKKEQGKLRTLGFHDSREAHYDENNGYDQAKSADDAGVREAQLKRLAEYQAQGKSVTERNREMLDSFKNLGQSANTASTEIQKSAQTIKSQPVVVPVKADTKEVTGIPTQVQEAMKNAKQVDIPVKADSTQVKTATNDVNKLKATTDQVKDKKVTLQADASGATKAVTEFGKNLSKMSQSVDIETSKSKQSFQKFYTVLQQTINTYTPMIVSSFKSTFVMAVTQTVSYLTSGTVLNQFKQIGVNAGRGMAEGLRTQISTVKSAAKELANAAASASKKALKEKSPSKVFFEIGEFGGDGLAEGFISSMSTVSKAAEDMSMESVSAALAPLANLNLDEIDTTPTIKPVLDMSDIESKSGTINSLLNQNHAAKISAEVANGKNQQQVQDQQMANQMQMMNQKLTELSEAMKNPTPVNVDVTTTLEGDARKFFTAMRDEDRRYTQRTGKSAFAT